MKFFGSVSLSLALAAVVVEAQAPGPTQPGTISSCNKWHIVKSGDTCGTLESTYKISHANFLTWNPAVSNDCLTNFWPEYAYCVGVGAAGISSTTTKLTTLTTARVTTPAGPTQTGVAINCDSWYIVQTGDTCGTVETRFNITHDQFLAWNPAVSEDCQLNFWPTYAYCVGIDPNAPTTRPTTSSSSSTTSAPAISTPYSTRNPVTSYTISTPVAPTEWPPTKTQAGQPSYCSDWHLVLPGETCEKITMDSASWMGLEDFYAWNPAVGTDCSGLYLNWYVCVGIRPQVQVSIPWELGYDGNGTTELPPYVSWAPLPEPTVDFNFTPTPTQGPLPTNCQAWYKTKADDNCRKIVAAYSGITQAQFLAWHPFLNGNCDGLWADYYYCVWAASDASLPPVPTFSTQPSPVPTGITSECKGWYQATALDECDDVVAIFGTFSLEQFVRWNPSVGTTASCDLLEGYAYCIAVPGTPTSRTSGLPPSTTTTTKSTSSGGGTPPTATPTPIQSGMVAGCNKFYLVLAGDGCWAIANSAGIDLSNFYAWNPALKTDCSGLWPDYYVCIGIGGT